MDIGVAEIVVGLVALMLIASGALALSNRYKFPFSIALLLIGILLGQLADYAPAALSPLSGLEISSDLILYVFLPTLIFESAFHLDWRQLRQNLAPVLLLAVPGLLISALLIALVVSAATGIPFTAALLLGAILSATDPVAVIALFKRLGAPQRLTVLVEGESLLNDATAIVLSRLLVGIVVVGTVTVGDIGRGAGTFLFVFFGGIFVGWVLGELFAWVVGKIKSDPAIEITLTTVLAYLSFLVAEDLFHVSGVMAVVTAGLSYGNRGWMRVNPAVRVYLEHFWEYLAFVATALIFLMVGLSLDIVSLPAMHNELLFLILGMLVARAVVVYGLVPCLNRFPGTQPVSLAYRTVMYWGGLRGAIALAIVLSLPDELAFKDAFVVLVTGAVLFTLLVQGLSMNALVRFLGLDKQPLLNRYGAIEGELAAKRHALQRLPQLSEGSMFSATIARRLRNDYRHAVDRIEQRLEQLRREEVDPETSERLLCLRALAEERAYLHELFNNGHLDERPFRTLLNTNAEFLDAVRQGLQLTDRRIYGGHADWRVLALQAFLNIVPSIGAKSQQMRVAAAYQIAWGHHQTCMAVLRQKETIVPRDATAPVKRQRLIERYEKWELEARSFLDQTAEQYPEFVSAMQERHARRLSLLAEIKIIREHARHGMLPGGTAEQMLRERRAGLDALRGLEVDKLRIEPRELLRKVPLFSDVPDSEFDALARLMRAHTISAGEDIIKEGARDDSLFLIARGVVRVIVSTPEGEAREIATLLAGDFFGEMALLHRQPRTATVRTVTPATVYELRRSDYLKFAASNPAVADAIAETDRRRRAELMEFDGGGNQDEHKQSIT